jgi:hypothetical protein
MKVAELDVPTKNDELICIPNFTCTKFIIHTLAVIPAYFGTPHVSSSGSLRSCYHNEDSLMVARVVCRSMLRELLSVKKTFSACTVGSTN